ncbi:MAG TPA: right-handed parallel beta-helix repeat-containing protein [Solirubrobacterales bacterium]
MKAIGTDFRLILTALALAVATWFALPAGHANAAGSCDKVASPAGSDANAGTVESPWLSAEYMAEHLAPGETGCFRAGQFVFDEADITQSNVTLTSYPGERATLKGTIKVEVGANQVTVSDLNLNGQGATDIGPFVFANETTFDNVDVTNDHTEICFVIGSADPSDPPATRTVIENSHIHDCGKLPSGNQDHGIYVSRADEAIIRDNWIYDNADRGVQLYPESHGVQVYGNVIDGNGEGVVVSDASSDNVIQDNVISNSKLRWNVEASNLYGTGNVVRDNCVWASNESQGGYYSENGGIMSAAESGDGIKVTGNTVADPKFVDAAVDNFTMPDGSGCSAPPGPPAITLQPAADQVQVGAPVAVHGVVTGAKLKHVTIQIQRHKRWSKFASAHVKPNGKFKLRKRLSRRLEMSRVHLRAKMPRVGRSRSVAIRIRG